MVYSATPDGYPVDKKGYNLHMSARPTGTSMVVAGASAFTITTTGDIPAGAIVVEDGTTAGRINISTGAAEVLLGVATVTRQLDDNRPLTYTWLGVVEMIAGTGNITKGDILTTDDGSAYYGCPKTWSADISSDSDQTAAEKLKFGKALTTATAGNRFWAYVNFVG